MDGEVGRFAIPGAVVSGRCATVMTWSHFPTLRGQQVYTTAGFREIALLDGTVSASYRQVARRLNRIRQQEGLGTPVTSLRDVSERAGAQIVADWGEAARHVVARQGWTPEALASPSPLAPVSVQVPADIGVAPTALAAAKERAQIPSAFQAEAAANPLPYGNPARTVAICADAVLAKQQKATRPRRIPSDEVSTNAAKKAPRERISNKVATLHHMHQTYAFIASTYAMLLLFVVAFLLKNKLKDVMLCFFVDGEKALHQAILTAMRWHPAVFIYLDWHHLVKKCAEMLSMGVKGKTLRNHHLKNVTRCLWYGASESAIAYLRDIPTADRKSDQMIEKLIDYLARNLDNIPCYAIRKQLGLRNSSNAVEKCNDLLVAARQKHQGMSWSKEGSLALAALGTVDFNGYRARWLQGGGVPLAFPIAS